MTICPKCGHHTPTTNEKLRGLSAARVGMAARVSGRHAAASHNEMVTDILAAEDVIDPNAAPVARIAREGGAR